MKAKELPPSSTLIDVGSKKYLKIRCFGSTDLELKDAVKKVIRLGGIWLGPVFIQPGGFMRDGYAIMEYLTPIDDEHGVRQILPV